MVLCFAVLLILEYIYQFSVFAYFIRRKGSFKTIAVNPVPFFFLLESSSIWFFKTLNMVKMQKTTRSYWQSELCPLF